MNQHLYKITSAIKVAPYEITDDYHYKWKPSQAYHKINSFRVSKDEWGTKDSPALYAQQYDKKYLSS